MADQSWKTQIEHQFQQYDRILLEKKKTLLLKERTQKYILTSLTVQNTWLKKELT